MKTHHLDHDVIHQEWNNALAPRLTIEPGDTVVFETRDAANRFYSCLLYTSPSPRDRG